MQQHIHEQQYRQEDEIDLRQLLFIVWTAKKLIITITLLSTILAGIYAFIKTPVYEATALVEIGHYKVNNNSNNSNNSTVFLDTSNELSKILNILFINLAKKEESKQSSISSINTVKNVDAFIEIKAIALDNTLASQKILSVVNYIKEKHLTILDDVKDRREFEIKNIETKIHNIQNKKIKLLSKKIHIQEKNLAEYKSQLQRIDVNIKEIESTNPALTALKLLEKNDISSFILKLNLQLLDMYTSKDELETTTITQLLEEKRLAESMLLPHNYQNSAIIGGIITDDYPIKPNKKIIVVLAFIAGFVLSIFLVLMMNAFKRPEDEKTTA